MEILDILCAELGIRKTQAEAAVKLLDDGNTVPFIARYRKEATGGLDDEVLRNLTERLAYLRNLEKRREEVISLIDEQGKLTDEIRAAVAAAQTLTEIDDIYRPYRPKRKTRASVARERGLEDLAILLMMQESVYDPDILTAASRFVDAEKEVPDEKAALAGACDIIAEEISDNADYRREVRALTMEYGLLHSKKTDADNLTYELYYDYTEKLSGIPSHRVLAINRGEAEEILRRATVRADRLSEEILAEANTKAAQKLAKADADIAQEKKKAVNEIKDEISGMSVDIAEAVVGREIKESDHKKLIDTFIDSL